jgi:hypothetical protein
MSQIIFICYTELYKNNNLTKGDIGMQFIRSTGLYLALMATVFSSLLTPDTAEAVPAFARQTGMPCMGCHFQNFPALNSFGRTFRSKGYTMQGTQTMIEGEDLSLPSTLNASVIAKIRYEVTGNADRGEIQWPDEAALLVGGRAANKVGFLMELGLAPGEAENGGNSLTCTDNTDASTCTVDPGVGGTTGNFLSAKFHFGIGDNFAIIPFSTDGLGVGYGFEMLNTGVQRSHRGRSKIARVSVLHSYWGLLPEERPVSPSFMKPQNIL